MKITLSILTVFFFAASASAQELKSSLPADVKIMSTEEANALNGTANPYIMVNGKKVSYNEYVAQQKVQQTAATNAQKSGLRSNSASPSNLTNPANAPAGVAPTGNRSLDRTTIKTEVATAKTETPVKQVVPAALKGSSLDPDAHPAMAASKTAEIAIQANSSSNSAPTEAKASVAKASSEASSTNSGLKHAPVAKETNFVSPAVTPLKTADVPVAAAKSAPVEAASTAPQFPGSANVQTTSGANAELLQVSASAQAAGSNNLPAAKAGTTQVAMEAVPESKVNSEVKKPAATLQGGQKSKD